MNAVSQAAHAALLTVFVVAGPLLATVLVIGVAVSVFLAVTQINEPTLSFVPKFLGTGILLMLLGPWLLRQLETFAIAVLSGLPAMLS
ncbi:MAG: flagellar biosynthetic protein FliQ [Alphaproteobacteria bacterium]|nr:flagellar biosynthetic protein FliQ [Alphaproteobacteria bacterium]MBV9553004.1 flagellar biosynthetic protein FliQ [Alphaproteobacteria bacterium]